MFSSIWREPARRRRAVRSAIAAACALALRAEVLACPKCYGATGAGTLKGFYWSAAILTALPFVVVATVAGWVAWTARRSGSR